MLTKTGSNKEQREVAACWKFRLVHQVSVHQSRVTKSYSDGSDLTNAPPTLSSREDNDHDYSYDYNHGEHHIGRELDLQVHETPC